ncbi:hypothetical protein ACFT54_09925 [Streptomyces cinereoruber]|uniref:hypothetical protein n=1 Tax=Streptomyces cinereoruber TaxID=67260 RepID=UPI00363EE6E1
MTHSRALHQLAGVTPVSGATGRLPHYQDKGEPLALCKRRIGAPLTNTEVAAAERFCSHCVKVAEKLAAHRRPAEEPETLQGRAARDFTATVTASDGRNAEIRALADAAGLALVHGGDDFDPHFARPDAGTTQCAQEVTRWLPEELAARVSLLCPTCERAARLRRDRLISEARQACQEAGPRVRTNPDPSDPEWIEALDRLGSALDYLEKHDPVTAEGIRQGAAEAGTALELIGLGESVTEGELLIAELAKLGREAGLTREGGVSCVVMAAAPDAPPFPYDRPHVLMYAGERADRPAADREEPWSAHLHGANGEYITDIGSTSPAPLGPLSDAARCAREVVEWLNAFWGAPQA